MGLSLATLAGYIIEYSINEYSGKCKTYIWSSGLVDQVHLSAFILLYS